MTWDNLLLDETRSPAFDDLHAHVDNYQIYSLTWNDEEVSTTTTKYLPAINQTVEIITGRLVAMQILPNTSPFSPNPLNLINRGYTIKYYSRLLPTIPLPTFETIDLRYDGDDDPNRTIARIMPMQSIVSFDPSSWSLDAEAIVPDTNISYTYQTSVDITVQYVYTTFPSPDNRTASVQVIP